MSNHSTAPSSLAGRLTAIVVASSAIGLVGCMTTLEARPMVVNGDPEVTWIETPPVNVEQYPHESYGGRDVYFVGGSWGYRAGGRWATYRREPAELGRRRARPAPARREPERREPERHEDHR
jgi:hypothetical protein